MKPVETLQRISGKKAPGIMPVYTPAHVLKALELIENGQGIGRQQLSRNLRLGAGSVRTLIKRFNDEGLIETSREGMVLSDKGRSLLDKIREKIVGIEIPDTSITLGSENYAILVRGRARNVRKGIEQRDTAMIAGAKGATTLIFTGEKLSMPGTVVNIEAGIEELLLSKLRPSKGDVIIIVTGSNPFISEMGAKSAALDLL
jgi:predicted transcriptional regulator